MKMIVFKECQGERVNRMARRVWRALWRGVRYAAILALAMMMWLFMLGAEDLHDVVGVLGALALIGFAGGALAGWLDEPATPYFD